LQIRASGGSSRLCKYPELSTAISTWLGCIKTIWILIMTREEIKNRFEIEATEHGKAISIGDHKKANKLHKELQSSYNLAKEQGQIEIFSELLDTSDENIRLWAATFTLKILPDLAQKSLERLTELTSITGLTAKTTLHLWKEGKLNLL
jgi:hypothetical protein